MAICQKCGYDNPDDFRFCGKCGVKLYEPAIYCPKCGKVFEDCDRACEGRCQASVFGYCAYSHWVWQSEAG